MARVLGEIGLPLAALFHGDFGAEGFFDLGFEGGEVELVPVLKPAGEFGALRRREIEDAVADGGDDAVALCRRVGAGLAESGEALFLARREGGDGDGFQILRKHP